MKEDHNKMSRREALSTLGMSALAAAGAGLGQVAGAQPLEAVSKKKTGLAGQPIRVALIGANNIGGKTHLPSLVGNSECRLVAVCDVDRRIRTAAVKKATDLYAQKGIQSPVQAFGDFRKVMSDESIDAVLIGTPDHWHVPLAKAAVLAGKDVYVEKPLSLYVTEGRELVEMAKNRDVIVQVGSQHRSSERFFLATAAVQSGLIGEVKRVDVAITTRSGDGIPWKPQQAPPELDYDMYVGPVPWTDYHPDRVHYKFRFVPDFSGGEIANWGAHFLDSAPQVMGWDEIGPVRVSGTGKRHPAGSLHYSFFDIDVDYEYPNGISMKLTSAGKGNPMGITFHGEKGTLFVNRKKLTVDPPELMRALPKEAARAMRKTKGSHMRNWIACIQSRRKEDLHAPVEIGNQSANLCHLANVAIEVGRPLEWDAERETFRNDASANALLNRPVRDKWRVQ